MKYLQNFTDYRTWIETPTYKVGLLFIFIVFVLVYRLGVNRWLYLNYPKLKKRKIIYCSTCFAFWLTLLISQNLVISATAFLIYNLYEKNNNN